MRTLLVVFSVAVLMSVGAFAQLTCDQVTTVGDFAQTSGCFMGDKVFTYVQSDVPGAFNLNIGVDTINSTDYYSIQVGRPETGYATGQYSFAYTVEVAPAATKWFLSSVELTAEYNPFSERSVVTKSVLDLASGATLADLTWTGNAGQIVFTDGFLSKGLLVIEGIDANDAWRSSTDTYTQSLVPEPSTLALMGGGLVLIGLLRRRFTR